MNGEIPKRVIDAVRKALLHACHEGAPECSVPLVLLMDEPYEAIIRAVLAEQS